MIIFLFYNVTYIEMDKISHKLTHNFILEESNTHNSTRDKLLNDCLITYSNNI